MKDAYFFYRRLRPTMQSARSIIYHIVSRILFLPYILPCCSRWEDQLRWPPDGEVLQHDRGVRAKQTRQHSVHQGASQKAHGYVHIVTTDKSREFGKMFIKSKRSYNQIQCIMDALKMLGRYLYTLIIGHTSCNMLSKLNKLTL